MEADSPNGFWKGWILTSDLTERDQYSTLDLQELSISKENFIFNSNTSNVSYSTIQLNWPCVDEMNACNPIQYIKAYSNPKKVAFESKQDLSLAIQHLIKQLPDEDPSKCIVIDFENPSEREITSKFICFMSSDNIKAFHESLNNGYYNAIHDSNLKSDIPFGSIKAEKFSVKIYEDKTVIETKVDLSKLGVEKYDGFTKSKSIPLIYYKNIASDKKGNTCSFWYKSINAPKELQVEDSNCCFMFKDKVNHKKEIFICLMNKYRCIKPARVLVKSMKRECSGLYAKDVDLTNPYNEENKIGSIKGNNKIYTDENNGIFKGDSFVFDLFGKTPIEEQPPFKLEIDKDNIKIYPHSGSSNSKGSKFTPSNVINGLNLASICGKEFCSISDFILEFEKNEPNKLRIEELKSELQKINEKMPKDEGGLDLCSVIQYKGNKK